MNLCNLTKLMSSRHPPIQAAELSRAWCSRERREGCGVAPKCRRPTLRTPQARVLVQQVNCRLRLRTWALQQARSKLEVYSRRLHRARALHRPGPCAIASTDSSQCSSSCAAAVRGQATELSASVLSFTLPSSPLSSAKSASSAADAATEALPLGDDLGKPQQKYATKYATKQEKMQGCSAKCDWSAQEVAHVTMNFS